MEVQNVYSKTTPPPPVNEQEEVLAVDGDNGSEKFHSAKTTTTTTTTGGSGQKELREGKACIIYNDTEVFYNPIQEFNRDLSILVIKLFIQQINKEVEEGRGFSEKKREAPGIDILEALSATGLRSIRYWKEIEGINTIVVNDLEPAAVDTIRKNLERNGIDTTKCIPNQGDCSMVMYQQSRKRGKLFDVVDIDPYGTASPFLDSAVQAVDNGGLLCVTCTDLAVLCGSHPETCYAKYQSIPFKSDSCHELSLRIVLNTIQSQAIRYKRYIEPVISIYVDFYVRIFVRVFDSANATKDAFSKSGMAFQCGGCRSFWTSKFGDVEKDQKGNKKYKMKIGPTTDKKCTFCGSSVKMGGPLWLAHIHNNDWLKRAIDHLSTPESKNMYKTHKRLLGLLSVCSEELDEPLFYVHSALCNITKLETPSLTSFRSAVVAAGYHVSGSHCVPNAIKTDAPNEVIWDIIRSLHKLKPANMNNLSKDSPGFRILATEPKVIADFTKRKDAESKSGKLPRFIHTPGGGPKSKAKGKRSASHLEADLSNPIIQKRKLHSEERPDVPQPLLAPMEQEPKVPNNQ